MLGSVIKDLSPVVVEDDSLLSENKIHTHLCTPGWYLKDKRAVQLPPPHLCYCVVRPFVSGTFAGKEIVGKRSRLGRVNSRTGTCKIEGRNPTSCHSGHFFFLNKVETQALIHTRIHSPLWTYTRTSYPYEHLRKTKPVYHLEIYEVTVGASSSTGTSPPTESAPPEILK